MEEDGEEDGEYNPPSEPIEYSSLVDESRITSEHFHVGDQQDPTQQQEVFGADVDMIHEHADFAMAGDVGQDGLLDFDAEGSK